MYVLIWVFGIVVLALVVLTMIGIFAGLLVIVNIKNSWNDCADYYYNDRNDRYDYAGYWH
jgi:hypothetical protein